MWQDTKDAKDVKAPDYITFVNFKNRDEFVLIDKNDSSAANKQVLSDIVSAVDEQGNNIYRIEGNLTASTSSGTVAADIVNFVPPAGSNLEPAMIDISTETGIARARKLGQLGYLKGGAASSDGSKATPNVKVFIDRDDPSQRKELDLNDPEQYKEFQALGKNWSMTTVPSMADLATGPNLGKGENAKLMQLLSNQDIMGAYSTNTLDPSTAELINGYLTNRMRLTPVFDETRQEHVMVPGLKVTQTVLDAIAARGKIGGASMPTIGAQGLDLNADPTDNTTGRIKFNDDNTIDFSTFENDPVLLITGIDLTKAQGFGSSVNRFFNFVVGQWGELPFGEKGSYAGEGGKITAKGTTQLNALARRVVSTARSGVEGKLFKYDMDLLKQEVDGFTPSGMNTDNGARDQLLVVRQNLASLYLLANGVATNPGIQKDIDKAVRLREQFDRKPEAKL